MPKFNATVTFDVFCADCGTALLSEVRTEDQDANHPARVVVQPCKDCVAMYREESFNEGVLAGTESVP